MITVLEILALVAALVGIVGSIVPGLPGPPVSWVGLLLLFIQGGEGSVGLGALIAWFVAMLAVTVLDYILPAKFTSLSGGHKAASTGAVIGLFAGLIIPPVGMIVGSVLGAFVAELMAGRTGAANALKVAFSAFAGFIATTGMKLIFCALMAWKIGAVVF